MVDDLRPPRQVRDVGLGVGRAHRVDDEPAGDPGAGGFPRAVDVGDDELVGVDEGVGEVGPEDGDPRVAVRLEDADDPTPAAAARRRERGRDLAGQVRVVVDERRAVRLAPELEAPRDAAEACQGTPDRLEVRTGGHGRSRRPGGVEGVVAARHGQDERGRAVRTDPQHEAHLGTAAGELRDPPGRIRGEPVGRHVTGRDRGRGRIVAADDRDGRGRGEETAERRNEALEGSVVVEVIRLDTRHDGDLALQLEERPVALVGLDDEPLPRVPHRPGTDLVDLAADDERRR